MQLLCSNCLRYEKLNDIPICVGWETNLICVVLSYIILAMIFYVGYNLFKKRKKKV